MTGLETLALLAVAAWAYLLVFHGGFWRCDQLFVPARLPDLDRWPAVAAIVPARDEAATIGPVMESLLAQDYPGTLSVTLVDDRSTDGTSARASAAIAASADSARATLLGGGPLPAGWAGKLWAQQQGID